MISLLKLLALLGRILQVEGPNLGFVSHILSIWLSYLNNIQTQNSKSTHSQFIDDNFEQHCGAIGHPTLSGLLDIYSLKNNLIIL